MVICPVCEHEQAEASECDVCGRDLRAFASMDDELVAYEVLPNLEQTLAEPVAEVALEAFPDIERHMLVGTVEVAAAEPVPELERLAPIGEVPFVTLDELTEDRAADDGVRTTLSQGPAPCPFCGHLQQQGTVCNGCGRRFKLSTAVAAGNAARVAAMGEARRCAACGAPVKVGERCSECGRMETGGNG